MYLLIHLLLYLLFIDEVFVLNRSMNSHTFLGMELILFRGPLCFLFMSQRLEFPAHNDAIWGNWLLGPSLLLGPWSPAQPRGFKITPEILNKPCRPRQETFECFGCWGLVADKKQRLRSGEGYLGGRLQPRSYRKHCQMPRSSPKTILIQWGREMVNLCGGVLTWLT